MRIGIDCQAISKNNSGLGKYTQCLIQALKEIDFKNQYVFFERNVQAGTKTSDRLWWENISLYRKAMSSKIQLLHTPAFSAPWLKGPWASVVTIHDLIPLRFSDHLSRISRWYWKNWLPYVNQKAHFIMADSEATKKDIVEFLRVDPERIFVIYLAADSHFQKVRSKEEIAKTLKKFNLSNPYLFYAGNVEPRKNLIRAILAYTNLKTHKKIPHDFVIAGGRDWKFSEFDELIHRNPYKASIKVLGFVSDDELTHLYSGTSLFIYPSLYEGFGFPVLEALTCQAPVLTSRSSSLPEIGGDSAYYVNPEDQNEIEEGILKILYNPNLQNEMRRKGVIQSQRFSWKETAEKTLAVYHLAKNSL